MSKLTLDSDDKPVGTIMSRREALRAATAAGLSLVLDAKEGLAATHHQGDPVHLVATPEVEEGPFFVDEKLNRADLVAGTTRATVVHGSPLTVRLAIFALRGGMSKPLAGAHVDVWHADAKGTYSDEESGNIQPESTKGEKWLRGYQVTGFDGKVTFHTIYPGWYMNRTPHIHVKIRNFNAATNQTHEFNTQLFFDERVNDAMLGRAPYNDRGARRVHNRTDGLYAMRQVDGTMAGTHLHLAFDTSEGSIVREGHFSLALDLN